MISSKSNSYIVHSLLGKGSFGEVKNCIRKKDKKTVAIKIQKIKESNTIQTQREVSSLFKLRELDPDECSIIRFYEAFVHGQQLCLVFEHLDKTLYNFVTERQGTCLPLKEIRPIVCQLANAFNHLSTLGIIHTDLKMDNVMLVNHIQEPYRVKLIDFGLAIDVSAVKAGSNAQPIRYRAPEVFLGLPFTEAIDMWSLGIMTATMFLGKRLFPINTEYHVMRDIVEALGQPPDYMLCHGIKTHRYFKRDEKSASLWTLKTLKEYKAAMATMTVLVGRRMFRTLDDLLHIHPINHEDNADKAAEMSDRVMFLDLLKGMLQPDPKKRITPRQVLQHPFITGVHLVSLHPISPHVQSCYDIMQPYQYCLDYDVGEAVPRSLEVPTSGPAHPIQSTDLPNVKKVSRTLKKSAGINRKVKHDGGTVDETSHLSKRVRSELHGGGYADPATASRSCDPTDHIQANAAVRSHPTQHHSVSTASRQQQADLHCIKTGIKRKFTDDQNEQIGKRFRQSDAAPSTSFSTEPFVPPGLKKERPLDDDFGHERKTPHEVSSLFKLRTLDPDKCNIVRFYEAFVNNGEHYLLFEHLDQSLNDFIKERKCKGLTLKEIRPIICQLANAFNHLSTLGIIHTDLKLDNVMLVNHIQEPYRVKLTDFGLAIDVSAAKAGSHVQPVEYRSPEVILGLPFTEAIDMWSLGIMAATMFLGRLLYPSKTEFDTMRDIVGTLGQPPDYMLCHGIKTDQYFKRDEKSASLWTLKKPKEYKTATGITPMLIRRRMFRTLDDLLDIHPINHEDNADEAAEMSDRVMFLDLLKGMLQLDPKKRITPRQVLQHPFITGVHLVSLHPISPHVQSCFDIMQDYQYCLDRDVAEAVPRSLEVPTSGPAHPIQSTDLPNVKKVPHTLKKSAGIKRKVKHDGGTVDETSHVSKRVRSELHGGGYADPAKPSRSCDPTDHIQGNAAVRSHPTQHHSVSTASRQQQADQHCIKTGITRKFTDDRNRQIVKGFRQSDKAAPSTSCSRTQPFVPRGVKRERPHQHNPDPKTKSPLYDDWGHKRRRTPDDDSGHERKKNHD